MSLQRTSLKVACSAIMGAMAVIITLFGIEIPYPPLPYLKFDLAEIPSILTLGLFDVWCALCVASIHFVALSFLRGWILGPSMKYIAVVSMILGFYLGIRLRRESLSRAFIYGLLMAFVIRCASMSIANYVVLKFISPSFLNYGAECLSRFLNIDVREIGAMGLIVVFTAIFNVLHTLLSALPLYVLMRELKRRGILWYEGL